MDPPTPTPNTKPCSVKILCLNYSFLKCCTVNITADGTSPETEIDYTNLAASRPRVGRILELTALEPYT
jgi:hypothetical protein